MGKLIAHIQNYPLSPGSVAYSNKLLLEDGYTIRKRPIEDYLSILLEISKDIYFYNDLGTNSSTWNELLGQDKIFQFSRFLTISPEELHAFFTALPQSNHFTSDVEITEDEYEILAYQRLQVIQFLFWFFKNVGESIQDENQPQVLSILKYGGVAKLFKQYLALYTECLLDAPVLIAASNQQAVANFNDVAFPRLEDGLSNSLGAYYNPANEIGNPVLTIYPTSFEKIKAANEYAYSIFKGVLKIYQTFNGWAASKLRVLVSFTKTHQAHVALLIAFCKLKMLYDARFDQLVRRNTKFIYQDILQLEKQPVLPDNAFIHIELAKNVRRYLVQKDTLFKAGKNSENRDVFYTSNQDVVLNSATIAYLKSTVRIYHQNQLTAVAATDDAANAEWQVNDAWLPFNHLGESRTGIAIESKLLMPVQKKDTLINFEFTFNKELPGVNNLEERFSATLLLNDGSEAALNITAVTIENSILKISAKIENDLKNTLKEGINARLKLISPAKNEQDNGNVILYKFLLSEPIGKIKVKMNQQTFAPGNVQTATGNIDGSSSFLAFGSQSLAGSSFRIAHPYLKYADKIDVTINWAEALKESFGVLLNNKEHSVASGGTSTIINDFDQNFNTALSVKLGSDLTYPVKATITRNNIVSNIESFLPRVLLIKDISLTADLAETIYDARNKGVLYQEVVNWKARTKSIRATFTSKAKQNQVLYQRHKKYRARRYRVAFKNRLAHIYPLGELEIGPGSAITFLPDYSKLGFNDFEGDLYIGLQNITPGESVNLLFEIAEETANQSELEATISWHFLAGNSFEAIETSRVLDTTNNFLQPGIVQLTLPVTATSDNTILYGENTYWLVARCTKNCEAVANIRHIRTNALSVTRVLNAENMEAKITVPSGTIENIFPKTANIKSVQQNLPSQNGRETESDLHYFWRSSQRLRHKNRAIEQWDFEQLILEKFNGIYKVKCLNHAYFNESNSNIIATATKALVTLIPHYLVNPNEVNFQPAIPRSKLVEVELYLKSKTSAFLQLQVLNTQWDEVSVVLEAVLNENILDLAFYQQQLEADIKRFLSPWAFQAAGNPLPTQKIYTSTLVDFIDELSYVHHIHSLRILKNGVEVFDEIKATTEIHFLTSDLEHNITVREFEP